uniref:Uncharacterized protein n=1 Tax=Mustela putorius furo TaxID=9669 RepID=M3Y5B5_MUSPF
MLKGPPGVHAKDSLKLPKGKCKMSKSTLAPESLPGQAQLAGTLLGKTGEGRGKRKGLPTVRTEGTKQGHWSISGRSGRKESKRERCHLRPVASLHEPSVDKEDAGGPGAGWGDISRIMGNE